jgi:diguanylate cyclase (GGDEF)-like protein
MSRAVSPKRAPLHADPAGCARRVLPGWLAGLFLALAGSVLAVQLDSPSVLLKKADAAKTSNYVEFVALLAAAEKHTEVLSQADLEYLRYLEAWKSGYDGDTQTSIARLTALIDGATSVTIRARAGATVVNMFGLSKRYEEAFSRLSGVLDLLPQVADGDARAQILLNAADLYNGVSQYDLSLSYAQILIDENWAGRGICKGGQQKLQTLYVSGRLKVVGPQLMAAIDECVRVGEINYANNLRIDAAQAYIAQEKYDDAISMLTRHYAEVKDSRNPRLTAAYEAVLADAYRRKGTPALAQQFAKNVIDSAGKDEFTEPLVTAYRVLYELARQRDDFKSALEFHERFAASDKAYLTDLSARHLAYQKVNHENIANKLQVDALNRQNHVLQLQRELGSKAVETSRLYIVLLTMTVVFIGLWAYRTKRSQLHFQTLSQLDGLTGICNRPHFIVQAEKALEASRRTGEQLCMILFDLDHFKSINDKYGHATGDFVLKRTVSACCVHLDRHEVFGRFGGEEFAILLPSRGPEDARQRAEQLRVTVAGITAYQGTTKATVSASFGIATTSHSGHELGQLLAHADAALYEAKRTGRNRVVVYGQPSEVTPLAIVAPTGDFVQYAGRSSSG